MRRQKADRSAVDTLRNHLIGKVIPGVGTWGEIDVLRGWKDDFLGCAFMPQYTPQAVGAGGGIQLQPNAHGGWSSMWTGAVFGTGYRLWLGNSADGFATLDADYGWSMRARAWVQDGVTNVIAQMGAANPAGTRQIFAGIRTDVVANNWYIRCVDGMGATNVDTGVAADTNWHWFGLDVGPTPGGGRQVKFFLDGALIGTNIANVPTDILTPNLEVNARGAAARNLITDFWAVIPRNLL